MSARRKKKQAIKERKLRDKRWYKQFAISALLVGTIVGLCARIGYIKAVYGDDYERMAVENPMSYGVNKEIKPNRGAIVDRNLEPLAVSQTVYSVIFDARLLAAEAEAVQEATIAAVAEILPWLTEDGLRIFLSRDDEGKLVYDRHYIEIAKQVPYQLAKEIEKHPGVKCIFLEEDTKRSYIGNNFAAHILGFIRGDASWGLERQYDAQMTGVAGKLFRSYDDHNNVVDNIIAPIEGNTLVTTLDRGIQQIAEDMCLKAGGMYEPENVSIIVMDPYTCEVLAMAGYPSFNLNEPDDAEFISDGGVAAVWDFIDREEQLKILNGVWKNYNISSSFEPGSIFKPVVIAAALEENIITPHSPASYYCSGFKYFAELEEPIRCWSWKNGGHGNQTLNEVISNSCNIAMMEIAAMMGRDAFYKYQKDFGYGERTGIDLPGEESFSAVMYPLSQLNTTELATSSFGQGFTCSPIQAITAFSALINGGNLMKPYAVSQVVDRNGNLIAENRPTVVRKVISKQTSDYLREAMVSVVANGTGKKAAIEGYRIGGKTGTGEQGVRGGDEYTYSFLAYLPAENPEIIAMMLINRPKDKALYESGTTVVPLLREVLADIIGYRNIKPSDPDVKIDATLAKDGITLENLTGLTTSEAISKLNRLGVDYEIIGGRGSHITQQYPQGGERIDGDTVVFIYTTTDDDGLVAVPDLKDLTQEQATDILGRSGFQPLFAGDGGADGGLSEDNGTTGAAGAAGATGAELVVVRQLPEPGVHVQFGTQIKMWLSVR